MRKKLFVVALIVVAFWLGDMTGATTHGAPWGCMPAPLPFHLGSTIVGYYADAYCHA